MKKINYLLLSVIAIGTIVISCKKNDDNNVVTPTRIKTITIGSNSDTFTYDSQNRILTEKPNGNIKTVYLYKGSDSVIILSVNLNTNDTSRSGNYKINANGVATQQVQSGNVTNFVYDANNYKIFSSNINSVTYADSFYVSSGNITQQISKYNSGISSTRTVIDYTLDSKKNTITNETNGKSFLGKSNANLITSDRRITTDFGICIIPPCLPPTITESNFNYTYEFDSNNRVTKQIKTNQVNSSTVVTTYTYY